MKIICGDRSLDLERMNAVKPDGAHVWAGIAPYTYHPEMLPESEDGTYFMTSDRGAVSIRDMAFKILLDMAAWSGARSCMYLFREIARSADEHDDGWELKSVQAGSAMDDLHGRLGLRAVTMPECGKLLKCNLRALDAPCDLDASVGGMLSDYVYTDGLSFVDLHAAISELLMSFAPPEFVMFMEGVYGALSQDPDELRRRREPEPEVQDQPEPAPEEIPDPEPKPAPESAPEPEPEIPIQDEIPPAPDGMVGPDGASPASGLSVRDMPKLTPLPGGSGLFSSGRKLKGSDLTGTDETYTLDYYAQFYKESMEQADSEGFADRLIRARAGDGVAPIAILEEAVTKLRTALDAQGSGRSVTKGLKGQLMELAGSISEAAGKLEALEDQPAAPEPEQKLAQAPKPEPEIKAAPAPESEPAVSQVPAPEPEPSPSQAPESVDEPVEDPAPAPESEPVSEAPAPAPEPEAQDGIAAPDFDEYDEYDEYGDMGSGGEDGPPEDPDDGAPDDL